MKIARNYDDIDWKQCFKNLEKLQFDILDAHRQGNIQQVLQKQNELTRSFSARALAVRKVTSNKGKNTPGIDKILLKSKQDKYNMITAVKNLSSYKAASVKRIYIPKSNGSKRPLGIPTIKDRVVQTLYSFALDPIVEETSDSRSYGFRRYRSVHDNATYLKLVLGFYTATRRFILKADIQAFFPSVSHDWLLENIPMKKEILKEFLKAGFLDDINFNDTIEGFPQGSPVSPALANLALNGLQDAIGEEFLCTRYADDFITLGKSVEELKGKALPRIRNFMKIRGLKLDHTKTNIFTIDQGFHFREYPDKYRIKGTKKGIFLITPSKSKIINFKKELTSTVHKLKKRPTYELILKVNQKLRGWAEHYRKVTSQKVFDKISFHVWNITYTMLRKKHKKRNATWIFNKYYRKVEGNKWILIGMKNKDQESLKLFQISYVPIRRHVLCRNLNPYDPVNAEYFLKRSSSHSRHVLLSGKSKDVLVKKQNGICPVCNHRLLNGESLEIHHVVTRIKGGTDKTSNLRLLHKECHRQVTYSKNKKLRAGWIEKGIIVD